MGVPLLAFSSMHCTALWSMPFLLMLIAFGIRIAIPYLPDTSGGFARCRDKSDAGKMYEDIVRNRGELGLITSYEPRQHPRYQSAFKLLDMAAKQESDSLSESDSTEDSSLFSDENDDEEEWQPKKKAIGFEANRKAEDIEPEVIGVSEIARKEEAAAS